MSNRKKATKRDTTTPLRVDLKLIDAIAKKHKVEYPTAEKVIWLTRVLHAISVSKIGNDFALMGGSAIVFLYRSMYRFSTDLDLDFIGNKALGKHGMAEIERRVKADRKALQQLARDLEMNFKVVRAKPGERFVQYGLEYRSKYTRIGVVELDISYRYCHSVVEPVRRPWPITLPEMVPEFDVQSLTQEELYASKVLAMVDFKERLDFPGLIGLMFKRKIRHLFDVYLLADDVLSGDCKMDLECLRDLVLLFGMTRIQNFEYLGGSVVGSYTNDDIRNELRSVVPKDLTIPTINEMRWKVRQLFDKRLFNWGNREHRFIEDFRAKKFRPEDLFSSAIAKRLHGMHYYKEILGKVRAI